VVCFLVGLVSDENADEPSDTRYTTALATITSRLTYCKKRENIGCVVVIDLKLGDNKWLRLLKNAIENAGVTLVTLIQNMFELLTSLFFKIRD
jgi:hypothetical protein